VVPAIGAWRFPHRPISHTRGDLGEAGLAVATWRWRVTDDAGELLRERRATCRRLRERRQLAVDRVRARCPEV